MTFHDVRFPDDVAVGAVGGPGYDTTVVTLASGRERRNVNWSDARGVWDVAHGLKTQEQLDRLIAFFRARRGKAYAFRFKDWSDFRMPRQEIGRGDGSATEFVLAKSYADDASYTVTRRLTRPVPGSLRVWVGGAETVAFSLSDGGVVDLNAAPAVGVRVDAECEFDVPARFDTDQMKVTVEEYGTFSWGQIPIVEVKE